MTMCPDCPCELDNGLCPNCGYDAAIQPARPKPEPVRSSAGLGRITVEELEALAAMWRAVAGGSEGPCWVTHEQGHRLRDAGLLDRYEVYEDEGGKFYLYEVSAVGEAVAVAWEDVSAALRPNAGDERAAGGNRELKD